MVHAPPPWHLEGEALVVLGRAGAHPLLLAAFHYTRSPVGPFVEVAAGEVGLAGGRVALRGGVLAVGSDAACRARTGWLPDQVPSCLKWWAAGCARELFWEERGIRIRAEATGTDVPATLPLRLVHPGWAAASGPSRLRARLSPAHVSVEVPDDDPLAPLARVRLGALFSSARLALDQPRRLRPRPAPAPALASAPALAEAH